MIDINKHTRCAFRRGAFLRIASLMLAMILALSPILVSAADGQIKRASDSESITVLPSALLSSWLGGGETLSPAEAGWLDREADEELRSRFTLTYDASLPTSLIDATVTLNDEESVVSVHISLEKYSANGMTWSPVSVVAELGEDSDEALLAEDELECTLILDAREEGLGHVKISAVYESKITYTGDDYSHLANAAYLAASDAEKRLNDYASASVEHEKKVAAYNEYREKIKEYNTAMRAYNSYINAKKEYESDLKEYNEYLAAMEKYYAEAEKYSAYLKEYKEYEKEYAQYLDFIKNPDKYVAAYEKYLAWLDTVEKVRYQLSLIDSAFVSDTVGHVLYATLHGDTVATVVENQDALVSTGCDATDIANADSSTKRLTSILDNYPRGASEEEKYTYYIQNYADLRDSVTLLYSSLARLYTNDSVPTILEAKDRLERYWQFVSQLYVLHCALDDKSVYNPDWTIANVYPRELLDDCYMLADKNEASPLSSYPEAVEKAPSPFDITAPKAPEVIQKPYEPATVIRPVEPEEVMKPVMPTVVAAPGDAPKKPIFSEALNALIEEKKNGTLTERVPAYGEYGYVTRIRLGVAESLPDHVTVSFYDSDRTTLLYAISGRVGDTLDLSDITHNSYEDDAYSYAFIGWKGSDGEYAPTSLTLENGMSSIDYFAEYRKEAKTYTVTWVVDGVEHTEEYEYGKTPAFDGDISKQSDAEFDYVFSAWSPLPAPVTADVTYTAIYTAVKREYTVTWKYGDGMMNEAYLYGEMPDDGESVEKMLEVLARLKEEGGGRYIYRFLGWDAEISSVSGDVTYNAVIDKTDRLEGLPEDADVSVTDKLSGISVSTKGIKNGQQLSARVNISRLLSECEARSLSLDFDGVSVFLRHDDIATLMSLGKEVYLDIQYSSSDIRIGFSDGDENAITDAPEVEITVAESALPFAVSGGGVAVYLDGEVMESAFDGEKLTFSAKANTEYTLDAGYSVSALASDGGICVLEGGGLYLPGETVTFSVLARPGYSADRIYVIQNDGQEIKVESNKDGTCSFIMPSSDVTLSAEFPKMKYTVVFMSDGQVLSSKEYFYGDAVETPADPEKASDGEYSYRFVGWDKTVTPVIGDAVYTAQFLQSELSVADAVPEAALNLVGMIAIAASSAIVVGGGMISAFFVLRSKKRTAKNI